MLSLGKTWEERLSRKDKQTVIVELRAYGLDSRQINSLMRYRGKVTELELILMRDFPESVRGRATIHVVKDALRTCEKLGLITRG